MKILVLKPSALGDIICGLAVAQSIRDQCPEAEISWVVKKHFAEIVRRCPTVNGEVIVFDHQRNWRGLTALMRVLGTLRHRHYDAVLDFQGLMRTGLMTRAAKSPLKIGSVFAREGSRFAYHRVVPAPADGENAHAIEKLLQFLPALDLQSELRSPIDIQGDSPDEIDSRLVDANPIVIVPNCGGTHKEWQGFPELTAGILDTIPKSVVVWDSHVEWGDPVVTDLSRFINLTTQTSLLEMVELIRRARLVIANDSGPLHMAAAFGRPTLGLYGPTSPDRYGPYPLELARNNALSAPDGDLSRLECDTVLLKVQEIISQSDELARVA